MACTFNEGLVYICRTGLWYAPLMLCTCINVASDTSHTSGDGTLVMRTGALEPGLLIGRHRSGRRTAEKESPSISSVRPELPTRADVFQED